MTSQYGRGRITEYKAIEALTAEGYLCTRAASSKGNWDVIAIGACANHVRLISCKRSKNERLCKRHASSERNRLAKIKVPDNCIQEVWVWLDGKGWYSQRPLLPGKDLDLILAAVYDPAFEKLRDGSAAAALANPKPGDRIRWHMESAEPDQTIINLT